MTNPTPSREEIERLADQIMGEGKFADGHVPPLTLGQYTQIAVALRRLAECEQMLVGRESADFKLTHYRIIDDLAFLKRKKRRQPLRAGGEYRKGEMAARAWRWPP